MQAANFTSVSKKVEHHPTGMFGVSPLTLYLGSDLIFSVY